MQLGYSLPQKVLNKIGVQNLRVYVSGENLWTGTKLAEQFDPETVSGGSGGNAYPLSRTLSCGLSLTFNYRLMKNKSLILLYQWD